MHVCSPWPASVPVEHRDTPGSAEPQAFLFSCSIKAPNDIIGLIYINRHPPGVLVFHHSHRIVHVKFHGKPCLHM
uniref:Uncharacterized protein n=1 Tax=Anguilla anguilla TaxID=7936 RepID=A0A0E9Q8A6_ANGAN